jgi:ribosomal protein S18 acetylase RimI-like enzyme
MKCRFCNNVAVYRCASSGAFLCSSHVRLQPVYHSSQREKNTVYRLRSATAKDRTVIGHLVTAFWGEPDQVMFGRTITIEEQPALVASVGGKFAGFISFSEFGTDEFMIVALAVLPEYQGCGVGRALISAVERRAKTKLKKRILVTTSNDDLPALAFYQVLGFQLFEVAPNVIAEKHGTLQKGIGNIPVRDELRLQKTFS